MKQHEPIRTLIVDDSRIFRGVLESVLQSIPEVRVIGSVFSGEKALEFIAENRPDLVTLDLEMPGIGGLETLKAIRRSNANGSAKPAIEVVLVSSLTHHGAACTIEGLQNGALDFILKPNSGSESENRQSLKSMLIQKIGLIRAKALSHDRPPSGPIARIMSPRPPVVGRGQYRAVAIGISTGGPEALVQCLPSLASSCHLPIFIVQHILPGFSGFLAESLSRKVGRPVIEAKQGLRVMTDGIYLAPSQFHMTLRQENGETVVGLSDAPAENGCRPAADVLFRSAAAIYGSSLIAVVMTGMGNDGANGIANVRRAGGFVFAQDEASSTVWGMPRAAIESGSVNEVVSLGNLAKSIASLIGGAA
jgi:two-component system, chemotaxis family, protein-glutamate methylesterase/glutaminase